MTEFNKDAAPLPIAAEMVVMAPTAPIDLTDCPHMGTVVMNGAPMGIVDATQAPSEATMTTAVLSLPHKWTTGLFDCSQDPRSCADATFCKPCQASRQYNKLTYGSNDIHLPTCVGVPAAAIVCSSLGIAPLAGPLFIMHLRQQARQRYGIEGSNAGDLAAAFCCEPCALAQQHREMSVRGEWPMGEFVSRPFALRVLPLTQME